VAVLTAALALGSAPTAAAKPGYLVEPPAVELAMSLRGSHGFHISIENIGRRLMLHASKGEVAADYAVRGHASRRRIEARFGNLGRVSVRFHRTRRAARGIRPPFCKGRAPIRDVGYFEGIIRFKGEQGFTSVSARRARGSVTRDFRQVCKLPNGGRPKKPRGNGGDEADGPPVTFLVAASKVGRRTVFVQSIDFELPGKKGQPGLSLAFVGAALQERRGRMSISRDTLVEGNSGTVLASAPGVRPVTATMVAPRPFGGTASYSEATDPPTWSGSLSVRLPGAGAVPLAGPGFAAALCRTGLYEAVSQCVGEIAKALGEPRLELAHR
jgi:hypothetical protein